MYDDADDMEDQHGDGGNEAEDDEVIDGDDDDMAEAEEDQHGDGDDEANDEEATSADGEGKAEEG